MSGAAGGDRAIDRVFTRGVIGGLLENGSNEVFDLAVSRHAGGPGGPGGPGGKTHGELFSELYAYLGLERRNEYYCLNTLLNRQLSGIHSVNTATALSQVRVGKSVADFVMLNGGGGWDGRDGDGGDGGACAGTVYEIKSALDGFGRLPGQLSDYFRAFGKVSVLTAAPGEFEKVAARLDSLGDMGKAVGICRMNSGDAYFSRGSRREPKEFCDRLDHSCIFKLLRKREQENALMAHYGELPQAAPVYRFRACLERFRRIPIAEAQGLALMELRKRNRMARAAFESIQAELRAVVYFSGLSRRLPEIEKLLQTAYSGQGRQV
jgi:hypothetical protein